MRHKTTILLCVIALGFFFLGLAFLPVLGFEYDEVSFIEQVFRPAQSFASFRLFHHSIPLMVMSYAGSLKTWIYAPIFWFTNPNAFSVRLPVLVLASATVLLIGLVVNRCAGSKAAVFACALLASDLNFLLTSVFDWGPVVIQNLLLAAGLYCLLAKSNRSSGVTWAAFLFGLALWDKAIFLWIFSGLVLSGFVFGFREIKREANRKTMGRALAALLIGALPLLYYNLKHHSETLRGNTKISLAEVPPKASYARLALNNQAFGSFFIDHSLPKPAAQAPDTGGILYRLAVQEEGASSWRSLWFVVLSLAGLLAARPGRRRLVLWLEAAVVIGWFQAAMTQNAGGFVHHIVIFYPALFVALGICVHEIAMRLGRFSTTFYIAVTLLLCLTGFNVMNASYAEFQRFSPSMFWTDADRTLAEYLTAHRNRPALIADWGIYTQADVRTRGALPLQEISFSLREGAVTGQQVQDWARSKALVILHSAGRSFFPDQNAKLAKAAQAGGVALAPVATIPDSAGHSVFEVDEFLSTPATR